MNNFSCVVNSTFKCCVFLLVWVKVWAGECDFVERLEQANVIRYHQHAMNTKKKYIIGLGIDPSGPRLHLGHLNLLITAAQLEKCGHRVVISSGSQLVKIGDPSMYHSTRVALTDQEVTKNRQSHARLYKRWFVDPIINNWDENLTVAQLLKELSQVNVSQLLKRSDFSNRVYQRENLTLSEMVYVGLDGTAIVSGADVVLMGRDMRESLDFFLSNKDSKTVIEFPLLMSAPGVKMGKSTKGALWLDADKETVDRIVLDLDEPLRQHWAKVLVLPLQEVMSPQALQLQRAKAQNQSESRVKKEALAKAINQLLDRYSRGSRV